MSSKFTCLKTRVSKSFSMSISLWPQLWGWDLMRSGGKKDTIQQIFQEYSDICFNYQSLRILCTWFLLLLSLKTSIGHSRVDNT